MGFSFGGDFAGRCARVELAKFRSRFAELCASPNANLGNSRLNFQAATK